MNFPMMFSAIYDFYWQLLQKKMSEASWPKHKNELQTKRQISRSKQIWRILNLQIKEELKRRWYRLRCLMFSCFLFVGWTGNWKSVVESMFTRQICTYLRPLFMSKFLKLSLFNNAFDGSWWIELLIDDVL